MSQTGITYSVAVPGTATRTSTAVRRCPGPAGPELSLRGCLTAHEAFVRSATERPGAPCLGWRPVDDNGVAAPFVFETYSEVLFRVKCFGAGLRELGLLEPSGRGQLRALGLYSKNCREWFVAEQACYAHRAATVPLYDALGEDAASHIASQAALLGVLASRENASRLFQAKASGRVPSLRCVILTGAVAAGEAEDAARRGLRLLSFAQVCRAGERALETSPGRCWAAASPGDVATLCYTSGTTGMPKGAVLTHQNLMAGQAAIAAVVALDSSALHLSYLPLPHVFERMVQLGVYAGGGRIAFGQGDPARLVEDLAALRPTVLPLVPRVLNKLHDKITGGAIAAGGVKARLFSAALSAKLRALSRRGSLRHPLYDPLVFNAIKRRLGLDRVRLMVTGSAPVAAHVMQFMRCLVGAPLLEGYGQTEGCGVATLTHPEDTSTGHVGGPVASVEVKLVDAEEMGYRSTDASHASGAGETPCEGRGEICIRGATVFAGYYEDRAATEQALDADGWLRTGDIGIFLPTGALAIVDRRKNIFKLAQGEYVAAERVENAIAAAPLVAQAFVHGDSLQDHLVAVVVPDAEAAEQWAAARGAAPRTTAALCADGDFAAAVAAAVREAADARGLAGYEVPRRVLLEPAEFSAENGLLTPTFKLKRAEAKRRYADAIAAMYAARGGVPVARAGKAARRSRL